MTAAKVSTAEGQTEARDRTTLSVMISCSSTSFWMFSARILAALTRSAFAFTFSSAVCKFL